VTSAGGFGSWRHLAGRFFGALSPRGPARADESWALDHLIDGEQSLWHRMSGPDRRHAVRVARDSIELLEPEQARQEVVAAALLHDVGKVESSFGTFARAAVTFMAIAFGRTRLVSWAGDASGKRRPSWRTRVGLYLTHDKLGAEMLQHAGSQQLTVSWAAEHHLAPELWTVDSTIGAALKAADGD
jgi:putative nucleotidyltransferase with HDIG domain